MFESVQLDELRLIPFRSYPFQYKNLQADFMFGLLIWLPK